MKGLSGYVGAGYSSKTRACHQLAVHPGLGIDSGLGNCCGAIAKIETDGARVTDEVSIDGRQSNLDD